MNGVCPKCCGFLAVEPAIDPETGLSWLQLHCLMCGLTTDPVMEANRMAPPQPKDRKLKRHNYAVGVKG